MAILPEGRRPLSDKDMINLLRTMADNVSHRDKTLEEDLNQTADRLQELSKEHTNE